MGIVEDQKKEIETLRMVYDSGAIHTHMQKKYKFEQERKYQDQMMMQQHRSNQ
jgi:NADPH:quinone reductase-like Zn-dependent oxidoreductase